MQGRSDLSTHQVSNQPSLAVARDLWADDPQLRRLVPEARGALQHYGQQLGRLDWREAARQANRHPPELRQFDSGGRRLDEVIFTPSYHSFMQLSVEAGYAAIAWEGGTAGHRSHAAMVYAASQIEPGHCCPLTMTYAAQPVLRAFAPDRSWADAAMSRCYDPRIVPIAQKQGATIGMAMTEKQGGSDIRATTTRALHSAEGWRLTGHKWFCSAPMSDGFLTLAQTDQGLSCFLVPRWLETGRNAINLMRLKDKLGNRSNASAELEYAGAVAYPLGPLGDGIRTILAMVHHTRLDTAMAPAGLMRAALVEAHRWLAQRRAFGGVLIDQPLMRAVLADATLDWLGALGSGLYVAGCYDGQSDRDRALARIGVAVAKYHANKLCPLVVVEAMEMLGGIGYVEDTILPQIYREAPLNGIWEGSGNVICLDVLRSLARDPLAKGALIDALEGASGAIPAYDQALGAYQARWRSGIEAAEARWFVEQSALLLSAAALIAKGDPVLAEAFVQTRLAQPRGRFAGALTQGLTDRVIAACYPDTAPSGSAAG